MVIYCYDASISEVGVCKAMIVTIDFDIIMKPSIELYNNLINDDNSINKIIKNFPFMEYGLTADLYIYEVLTRYLITVIKKLPPNKIHFIKSHEQICEIVKDYPMFDLYNIDHHHDIGYKNIERTSYIQKPECGNWVKYLSDLHKINHYYWINNDNSVDPKNQLQFYLDDIKNLRNFNLKTIEKVDELIICNSLNWIPANLQALFMTWIGIAEEYYNKTFDFDN